jgi:hypothetical protein
MLIASLKKETNIVEYVLYMYQIEDIIRSFQFNLDLIDQHIIQKFDQDEEGKGKIRAWYIALIRSMKTEGIEKMGHLGELKETINGLNVLHQTLLTTIQDKKYQEMYEAVKSPMQELVKRSGAKGASNEIEIALNGLYGLLVLRLKKKEIGSQTQEEMAKISTLLAHLNHQFFQMKMGKLSLTEEKQN